MNKRRFQLLLPLLLLVAPACDTEQRAQGGEQRVGANSRDARPTVSAELACLPDAGGRTAARGAGWAISERPGP